MSNLSDGTRKTEDIWYNIQISREAKCGIESFQYQYGGLAMKPGTPERLNLFFNKIVLTQTEIDEQEISKKIDEVCSHITDWEEADSYQYEKMELDLNEGTDASIIQISARMHVLRYWYDELANKTRWLRVYDDKGKLEPKAKQGRVVIFHPSDLIWLYPSFIAIRGAEDDVDIAFDKFRNAFSNRVTFESFSFHPMFLFWIWRKWATQEKGNETESPVNISNGLKVRRIRAVTALGIKSQTGGNGNQTINTFASDTSVWKRHF
jgi:hypothetical protein